MKLSNKIVRTMKGMTDSKIYKGFVFLMKGK